MCNDWKELVGDCNIKFCILCYLLALMAVCTLYARGYKHSSSTGRRGLLLSHEIRLATGVWRTEEPW